MKRDIKISDVVALLQPIADQGLQPGQIGTVVEILDEDVLEIEFMDHQGQTQALIPVHRTSLVLLRYESKIA